MKVCGWKDLKTMQFYIRLAGIDEQGATEPLHLLVAKENDEGADNADADFTDEDHEDNGFSSEDAEELHATEIPQT
jgi:ribulose bisphosphate carboxylase small subunit